jgi:hypothetical protein
MLDRLLLENDSALLAFNVANDGTITYDPALAGLFSGQGTASLVVLGETPGHLGGLATAEVETLNNLPVL